MCDPCCCFGGKTVSSPGPTETTSLFCRVFGGLWYSSLRTAPSGLAGQRVMHSFCPGCGWTPGSVSSWSGTTGGVVSHLARVFPTPSFFLLLLYGGPDSCLWQRGCVQCLTGGGREARSLFSPVLVECPLWGRGAEGRNQGVKPGQIQVCLITG